MARVARGFSRTDSEPSLFPHQAAFAQGHRVLLDGASSSSSVSQSLLSSPNLSFRYSTSVPGIQLFLDTKVTQASLGTETGALGQSRRKILLQEQFGRALLEGPFDGGTVLGP